MSYVIKRKDGLYAQLNDIPFHKDGAWGPLRSAARWNDMDSDVINTMEGKCTLPEWLDTAIEIGNECRAVKLKAKNKQAPIRLSELDQLYLDLDRSLGTIQELTSELMEYCSIVRHLAKKQRKT